MALIPLRLFRGDGELDAVESFAGFTDLALPPPPVMTQGTYQGGPVTIANGDNANLPWTVQQGGTGWLDRSTIAVPTFTAAGFYAITARVGGVGLTPGGDALVSLVQNGAVALCSVDTLYPALGPTVVATFEAGLGDSIAVNVLNRDGAAARDFDLTHATVVRLS